jgi:hypothetical protein
MIADTLIDNPGPECDVADTQDLPDAAEIVPGLSANVLLAEDNEVNQEIAHEYLVRLGCTVTIVQNGREAVDRFPSTLSLWMCRCRRWTVSKQPGESGISKRKMVAVERR